MIAKAGDGTGQVHLVAVGLAAGLAEAAAVVAQPGTMLAGGDGLVQLLEDLQVVDSAGGRRAHAGRLLSHSLLYDKRSRIRGHRSMITLVADGCRASHPNGFHGTSLERDQHSARAGAERGNRARASGRIVQDRPAEPRRQEMEER